MIPMNLFVGLLQVITPLYLIFSAHGDQATIVGASGLFLFGFTYLYVAMNNAFDLDGTGLGWFSLFVAVAAVVYSWWNFANYSALTVQRQRRSAICSASCGRAGPCCGSSSSSCSVSARRS